MPDFRAGWVWVDNHWVVAARSPSPAGRQGPLVSVVIPLFNGRDTVAKALTSLQAQDVESWEAIVVDDGSADGGGEVALGLASRDARIRVRRQQNAGVAAARNAGLEMARGAFVLFLDADDWMLEGALRRLVESAEAGTGAAYGAAVLCAETDESMAFVIEPAHALAGRNELLERNPIVLHTALVRRELLAGLRFDADLAASEDWDFWLRAAERGVEWRAVHEPVGAYRLRPTSRSRRWRAVAEAETRIIDAAFRRARSASLDLDLSEARREAAALRRVLFAATAARNAEEGIEILRPFAREGVLDADDAAEAAYWGVPAGLGDSPRAWSRDAKSLVRALSRFWSRCRSEGWTESLFTGRATACLARRMIDGDEVARLIAEELNPRRPVVLLGFGHNGRRLARVLLARGFIVSARDDARIDSEIVEVGGGAMPVGPGWLPVHAGAQYVVTPGDDAAIVSRLPVCLDVLRWAEAREALYARTATRLLLSWPAETDAMQEAA